MQNFRLVNIFNSVWLMAAMYQSLSELPDWDSILSYGSFFIYKKLVP